MISQILAMGKQQTILLPKVTQREVVVWRQVSQDLFSLFLFFFGWGEVILITTFLYRVQLTLPKNQWYFSHADCSQPP